MHTPKLFLLSGFLLSAMASHAQDIGPSAIDAAGASVIIGGTTHEYAIGQVVAGNTFSSASLVVTQDVLQPVTSTGINDHTIAAGEMQVYPSPAENTVFLQPAFNGGGLLSYSLYDAAGKLVISNETRLQNGTERQHVAVSRLAAGQYMLQVSWLQAGITYTAGYKVQKLQ